MAYLLSVWIRACGIYKKNRFMVKRIWENKRAAFTIVERGSDLFELMYVQEDIPHEEI